MDSRAAFRRWAVTTTSDTESVGAVEVEGVIRPRWTVLALGAPGSTWATAAVAVAHRAKRLAAPSSPSLIFMDTPQVDLNHGRLCCGAARVRVLPLRDIIQNRQATGRASCVGERPRPP